MIKRILFTSSICCFSLVCVGESEFAVSGGRFYEYSIKAAISSSDITNGQAIGVCYMQFVGDGLPVRVSGSFVSGIPPNGEFRGYEYLFADNADSRDGNVFTWRFQFVAPESSSKAVITPKPWRNIAPVAFESPSIRELPSEIVCLDEQGVEYVRTPSVGDNEIVASGRIVKNEAETECLNISVFEGLGGGGVVETNLVVKSGGRFLASLPIGDTSTCPVHVVFKSAKHDAAAVDHGVRLSEVAVRPRFRPIPLPSKTNPVFLDYDVRDRSRVTLVCSLVGYGITNRIAKAAIARVVFKNEDGNILPAIGMSHSEAYGDYFYLTAGDVKSNGITRTDIAIPAGASKMSLGLSKWGIRNNQVLSSLQVSFSSDRFALPPEFLFAQGGLMDKNSLQALLDTWLGEDGFSAIRFREEKPRIMASWLQGFILRRDVVSSNYAFRLKGYQDFDVSGDVDWKANPFNSSTWLLKYCSGFWIPFAAPAEDEETRYNYVREAWRSFWRTNGKYPSAANNMVYNDHVLAARIEGIITLLYGLEDNIGIGRSMPPLYKKIAHDPEFLKQLLYQLYVDVGVIMEYFNTNRLGIHNHNLIMAKALLLFADAFPMHPLSGHYRDAAVRIIFSHMEALFESDMFIREQSASYHHAFAGYFVDFFCYLKAQKTVDGEKLNRMNRLLAKILAVDAALACPDSGATLSIGDSGANIVRKELEKLVARFAASGGFVDGLKVKFEDQPALSIFKRSGIYVFRNAGAGRMLLVDISDNRQVHGHYDCGNFYYFSGGTRWISDLGGPYKYASGEHRSLMGSASHSVAMPRERCQKAGRASNVILSENESSWTLSFDTNVYGPEYLHRRTFKIDKNLSCVSVEDDFHGLAGKVFDNRIIFGPDVSVKVDDSGFSCTATVVGGNGVLTIETDKKIEVEDSNASYATHKFTPVKILRFSGTADAKGVFKSSFRLSSQDNIAISASAIGK